MAEIKTSAFCGLSRSADWQNWLKDTAPDLYNSLLTVISTAKGCRANSNKMMDIYFELDKRGLEPQLITFLQRRFPWMIKTNTIAPKQHKQQIRAVATNHQIKNITKIKDWDSLNQHKVFTLYRPDILSFPQKFIIIDHPNNLHDRIQVFVKNKLAVDYIVVDNHAYIEYFDIKYAAVIDKIPRETRDIFKYRLKMQQNAK